MTAVPQASDRAGRRRWGRRAGSASVEFALTCSALFLICLGVLDLGIILWTEEAVQSAAGLTARCVALGATPCTNVKQYAVTTATAQTFNGVVTTANVTYSTKAVCPKSKTPSGSYAVVTITPTYWATRLPGALHGTPISATACSPM